LKVAVFGSSFVPTSTVPFFFFNKKIGFDSKIPSANVSPSAPTGPLEDAIAAAEKKLDETFNDHAPTLEFLALEDGSIRLTHVVQIQTEATVAWFEAFVDAHSVENCCP
jgi:extracellular elastinolytic metalloproteinase